jgi:hypothetical protein
MITIKIRMVLAFPGRGKNVIGMKHREELPEGVWESYIST